MSGNRAFAARLKQLRERAGLTQKELASRAGMNRFGVAKLEQGQREPTWGTVQALARALGISCEAFMAEGEPSSPAEDQAHPRGRPRKAPAAAREGRSVEGPAGESSAGDRPAKGKSARQRGRGRAKGE